MHRAVVFIALVLTLAAAGAGLASPAGAIPTMDPATEDVFVKAGQQQSSGVAVSGTGARYICGWKDTASQGNDLTLRRVGSSGWSRT